MMSRMMMMTNERKIWEAALLLVRRHGAAAAEIAQQEAQRLRRGDDELTCVVWCWIARSTAELLRPVPSKAERGAVAAQTLSRAVPGVARAWHRTRRFQPV